jgi:hypothetical protein
MKTNLYSRKKRQLSRLVEELSQRVEAKSQDSAIIHRLKLRIKFLIQEMTGFVSKLQLKRILGAFAVVFGLTYTAQAQVFLPAVQNPFGITTPAEIYQFPEFADLDNDGDLDILAGSVYGTVFYYQNTGTATAPAFGTPIQNPFGFVPDSTVQLNFPTIADIDGDGDLDLLFGEYYGTLSYYENTGTATVPNFATRVLNPFGLAATYSYGFPDFVDIDSDGDMDLMVGEYYGNLQYFQNIGTLTVPNFAAPIANPFGLTASTYGVSFPEFADFDQDGDQDLLLGQYGGNFVYFENTGSAVVPAFAAPQTNPFSLTPTYLLAFPAAADLDGDGDPDLLSGEYYGTFEYFENTDPTTSIVELADVGTITPNPVVDVLHFKMTSKMARLEIVDLSGKIVMVVENPTATLNVANLDPGLYLLNCTLETNQKFTHKIQKL